MKVGTQLTVMMLACLAPIGLACTVIMWRSTPEVLSQNLKAEARAAQWAVNVSLASDVEDGDWGEVDDTMSAISREGLAVALLDESARLQFALPGFPIAIPARHWISARIKAGGAAEFMRHAGGRSWYCRIEP